jgi:hypothetical protein
MASKVRALKFHRYAQNNQQRNCQGSTQDGEDWERSLWSMLAREADSISS